MVLALLSAIGLPVGLHAGFWTKKSDLGASFGAMAFANGQFYALGNYTTTGLMKRSTDLISWTNANTNINDQVFCVVYGNSLYVQASGNASMGTAGVIRSSADGITWTNRLTTTTPFYCLGDNGSGTFIAGTTGGSLYRSTNGINWTSVYNFTASSLQMFWVAYGNGRWVVVASTGGADGAVLTSTDGTNWTKTTLTQSQDLYGVAYGNGKFAAVGASGAIYTSTDGTTWIKQASPTTAGLYLVAFGQGEFVAVGSGGAVVVSRDGTNWQIEASGTSDDIYSVMFGNGRFAFSTGTGGYYLRYTPPTISSIAPAAGLVAGGTSVVITGTNFTGATAVKFGSLAASSFMVNSATQITAVAPAGTGTVAVLVTTGDGTNATGSNFAYVPAPTITSSTPATGPTVGGTSVVITGTNFTGATAVQFGSANAASFTVSSATQITAVSPAGTGIVNLVVTTPGGTATATASFTYDPPTIANLTPASGPTAGGTSVAISGTNFSGVTAVKFGASSATSFIVNSASLITATSPAGTGIVDITVTTASGTNGTSAATKFTFQIPTLSYTQWAQNGFTAAELSDPALSGPTADNEGTGISNLMRFAFGLPTHGAVAHPVAIIVTGNSASVAFAIPAQLAGLQYTIQTSSDLVAWADDPTIYTSTTELQNIDRTVKAPTDAARFFIRLRIQLTP